MSKRGSGGRSAKDRKAKRRPMPISRALHAQTPDAATAVAAESSAPRTVEARPPIARPTVPSRQSVLSSVRRPTRPAELVATTNYSYVLHDLRRIAILAGAGFGILILLSLVIR